MSLPCYSDCKDSGMASIGAIPEHWDIKPIKAVASINDDVLPETTDAELEFKYIDIGSVSLDGGVEKTERFTFKDAPSRARRLVRYGDVIVSTVRTYLKAISAITMPPEDLVVSTGFAVVRPQSSFDCAFAKYALQSQAFVDEVISRSTGISYPAINASDLARIVLPVPPVPEQVTIATFLDRETGKISALIAEQEKLLTLLAEKRQATISYAVTRGLVPDVPLKDSGVAWLERIPAHWDTFATKRLFRLVSEPAPDSNDEELLSIYTDIGVRPRKSLEERGNKATTTDGYWIVRKGDIIVNKLLAWMGAIGLSSYDGVTSPAYDILRQTRALNPQFYDYLFRCGVMFTEFRRHSRGIMDMRLRLYFEDFGQIYVPFPPEQEQTEIVRFLQHETARLDALRTEAERAIELLKERRNALITAAVTGRIDVRNAVPQELAA